MSRWNQDRQYHGDDSRSNRSNMNHNQQNRRGTFDQERDYERRQDRFNDSRVQPASNRYQDDRKNVDRNYSTGQSSRSSGPSTNQPYSNNYRDRSVEKTSQRRMSPEHQRNQSYSNHYQDRSASGGMGNNRHNRSQDRNNPPFSNQTQNYQREMNRNYQEIDRTSQGRSSLEPQRNRPFSNDNLNNYGGNIQTEERRNYQPENWTNQRSSPNDMPNNYQDMSRRPDFEIQQQRNNYRAVGRGGAQENQKFPNDTRNSFRDMPRRADFQPEQLNNYQSVDRTNQERSLPNDTNKNNFLNMALEDIQMEAMHKAHQYPANYRGKRKNNPMRKIKKQMKLKMKQMEKIIKQNELGGPRKGIQNETKKKNRPIPINADPSKFGLSEVAFKFYLKLLREGRTNMEARNMAFEAFDQLKDQTYSSDLEVAILDEHCKDGKISAENWLLLEKKLQEMEKLHLKNDSIENYSFCGNKWYNGIKIVNCVNEKALNWLKKAISEMRPIWPDAKLKVIPRDSLANQQKVQIWLPLQNLNDNLSWDLLKCQNHNFNVGDWKLVSGSNRNTGRDLVFIVDNESIKNLERLSWTLNFGLDTVRITSDNIEHLS